MAKKVAPAPKPKVTGRSAGAAKPVKRTPVSDISKAKNSGRKTIASVASAAKNPKSTNGSSATGSRKSPLVVIGVMILVLAVAGAIIAGMFSRTGTPVVPKSTVATSTIGVSPSQEPTSSPLPAKP